MKKPLYYFIVRGFLQLIISIFGVICNSISAVVLTRPVMRSSINFLLLGLALADNIYLGTQIILHGCIACLEYFDANNTFDNYYLPFLYPPTIFFSSLGQTASTYFTVAITLERFIAVCWPLHKLRFCTVRNAGVASCVISAFAILYSIPAYFEQYPEPHISRVTKTLVYRGRFTKFGRSYAYQILYLKWGFAIVNFGIPFTELVVLNIAIYVKIRKAIRLRQTMTQSETAEISIARMLLCVVLVFGICYFPTTFYFFYASDHHVPELIFVYWLGYLTTSINSSVNFIIYCLMSPQFRNTLCTLCGFSKCVRSNKNTTTLSSSASMVNRIA